MLPVPGFIYIIFILIIISACSTTDEERDYTYSISKAWWSDSLDSNTDGYVQQKTLNFSVLLIENVSRNINARVYYKRADGSSFSFYAYTLEKVVQGGNIENDLSIKIGKPNKELNRGMYDFLIEVYEINNSRMEASTEGIDSTILYNNAFESFGEDKTYEITSWWTDSFDGSNNGFWRYSRLNIDIDVDDGSSKIVDANILYRDSASTEYNSYYNFSGIEVNGITTADSVSLMVGKGLGELSHNIYDFKIELYEHETHQLVAYSDESDPNMNDIKFETEDEDTYYFSIVSVLWSDAVDSDGDGFMSSRKLTFNVDVDKPVECPLIAKFFIRDPDTSDYQIYDSTGIFNIYGATEIDEFTFTVGNSQVKLDSNYFDFLISVYEVDADTAGRAAAYISANFESTLADQQFETAEQDSI